MLMHKEYLLVIMAFVVFVLLVTAMAENQSHYTNYNGGCGIFVCSYPSDGRVEAQSFGCKDYEHHIRSVQAFTVMAAVLTGVTFIVTVMQLTVPAKVPPAVDANIMFANLLSAAFLLIAWCIMCAAYESGRICRDFRISGMPGAAPGYGIFFVVCCSIFEFMAFFIRKEIKEERTYSSSPL
ncbi:hypothetical protein DIPPA_10246 [Diplonema papillatum]|nr:hypothetical protein DIPPA_10246 [Diplonema papillatum]